MWVLIVAQSARLLAQAARQCRYVPLVIDCYGDQDTQRLAFDFKQVSALTVTELRTACAFFKQRYAVNYCLYGSGFEQQPDSLQFLAAQFQLLGNPPETFCALHDKPLFFNTLQQLQIPHPDVRFQPPKTNKTAWLQKPIYGQGGVGITFFTGQKTEKSVYYQRYIDGVPMSVLFVANQQQARIVGFNQQWTTAIGTQPFVFKGIIGSVAVDSALKKQIDAWLQKLTARYALRGLNSLDFILTAEGVYVLEINPRPPASTQLYQANLLAIHCQACFGFFGKIEENEPITAYQIIYTREKIRLPSAFNWPIFCVDLPQGDAIIRTGQPICSMIARGDDLPRLASDLRQQEYLIFQSLQAHKIMEYTASVNQLSQPLVRQLLENADKLRVTVQTLDNGCTLIDAGITAPGGLEAGRLITKICLGGLGTVSIAHATDTAQWPLAVNVHTSNPVLACLGSQYAGWSLAHGKYYALGSGPARAIATKIKQDVVVPVEELYKELDYRDTSDSTVLVIENDKLPPLEIIEKVAAACGLPPSQLTIIVTPTRSLAGCVQVVGRVLEVAMHKAHALHFPLDAIVDGSGSAPICPPHPNFVQAMGRTNDAILFAGQVHLFVKGSDEAAEKLAHALPSSTSKDYGKPFAQIFKDYQYDFFKIDAMLFSPARVIVTAVDSGRSFRAGRLDNDLLNLSFGYE